MKLLTKVLASEQDVKEVSEFLVNIARSRPQQRPVQLFLAPREAAVLSLR